MYMHICACISHIYLFVQCIPTPLGLPKIFMTQFRRICQLYFVVGGNKYFIWFIFTYCKVDDDHTSCFTILL